MNTTKHTARQIKALAATALLAGSLGASALAAGAAGAQPIVPIPHPPTPHLPVYPPQVHYFSILPSDVARTQVTLLYNSAPGTRIAPGSTGYEGHLVCLNGFAAVVPVTLFDGFGAMTNLPVVSLPVGTFCETWLSTPAGHRSLVGTIDKVNDPMTGYDWVYATGTIS